MDSHKKSVEEKSGKVCTGLKRGWHYICSMSFQGSDRSKADSGGRMVSFCRKRCTIGPDSYRQLRIALSIGLSLEL